MVFDARKKRQLKGKVPQVTTKSSPAVEAATAAAVQWWQQQSNSLPGGFHFQADSWHFEMDKLKVGFDLQFFFLLLTLMFEIS